MIISKMKQILIAQVFLLVMGFSLSSADPCLQNYGGCDKRNGLCWETSATTHFCTCKAGYKQDTRFQEHTCVDANECQDENVCDQNSICQNTMGSYVCHCKCGYVIDYTGQKCLDAKLIKGRCHLPTKCYHQFLWWIQPVAFKTSNAQYGYITDLNSMSYHAEKVSHQRDCSCESGYRFDTCGYCVDIDECAEHSHECTGPGSKCVNTEGAYYCECKVGHTLGPCSRRCYAPGKKPPQICLHPDLSRLSSVGLKSKSLSDRIIKPFPMPYYPRCAKNTTVGTTTVRSYDLNGNGMNDITLTWQCTAGRRSILKKFTENEAKWGPWFCWTACKATCWEGGLQTRVRTCLNGVPGLKGCSGRGSDSRSCYSGERCPFRIRKDATTLTKEEIEDFIQAMDKYKRDMIARGFHHAASAHSWPFQCDNQTCCPHKARFKFFAWHRTMVLNFEEGFTRYLKNKTLGLAYWNWLATDHNTPALVWNKTIRGSENPFANMTVRIDLTGPMRTIQRNKNVYMPTMNFSHDTWKNVTVNLAAINTMQEFAESLESAHGGPHVASCDDRRMSDERTYIFSDRCDISFGPATYSAFDPLFLFHHTQIDRLWAVAQKKMVEAGTDTWTAQTALEALEDKGEFGRRQMPFGNTSLNAFPVVQAVNTMSDSYYHHRLTGVKYDYIGNDGFPPEDTTAQTTQKVSRVGGSEAIFIAHYLRRLLGTLPVYINYFVDFENQPCNRLQEHSRVGRNIIVPTEKDDVTSVATLVAMEKVGNNSLDTDFPIKACYTNRADCLIGCPPAGNQDFGLFASPAIVHKLPNEPVDIHKSYWERGNRMPEREINLDGSTQWLYFYGSRAKNIFQSLQVQNGKLALQKEVNRCYVSSTDPHAYCPSEYIIWWIKIQTTVAKD